MPDSIDKAQRSASDLELKVREIEAWPLRRTWTNQPELRFMNVAMAANNTLRNG